jgi:Nif-specific regulatory protein
MAEFPSDPPEDDWRHREVLLIREVGRLLGRSVEPNYVIRQTLRLLSEWVGLNRGRMLLWDAGEEVLRIRHAYGLTAEEVARGAFARGEGVSGEVLRSGLPRVVQDIDAEPEFLCRSVPRHRLPRETVAFIAVPLRDADSVIGVLAAHRLRHRRRAIDDDLELLQTIGTLLGQLIRVNEELRRRTERLASENRDLRERLGQRLPNFGILGDSPALQAALGQARRLAAGDATVLLLGESGTGKELFARAIHQASPRAGRPFVKVNCAAVPESLFESEFFGHERGAFTGAVAAQPGRFDASCRSTCGWLRRRIATSRGRSLAVSSASTCITGCRCCRWPCRRCASASRMCRCWCGIARTRPVWPGRASPCVSASRRCGCCSSTRGRATFASCRV